MFLETAYGSQAKLIGQSLCVSEHGTGYSNWPLQPIKAKNTNNKFNPLKYQEGLEIQS